MSILKSILEVEKNSKISLIYGNRDEASIIFKKELDSLSEQYADRLRIIHILATPSDSWIGMKGLPLRSVILGIVQDLMSADQLPKSYWMCGPAPMMEECQAALGFLGIERSQINREIFTAVQADPDAPKTAPKEGKRGTYTITAQIDGEEKQVLVKENQTILDAIIDDGMDPPYACQMGVCCTCRAIVHSGKVEMEEDEGLSDAEISDGYVLTCQSHPLTDDVVLEYK